ncbi:multidrug efflux system outer membrane protein [Rubrivivax gelatinosus]|uniref:Multidrug efflux system outer membrane protein n=1 Tax=Rubrivivax gelatinosus TaxID=28068 RepID=A0A4R2MCV3_RUBGE|nr:efflux transporter outer membrane subunit [Rubrivivax gelatinosus]TCP00426.1 multidrug efflux system outer membrane protein [Rubrivivax gelatinosus]
MKLVSMTPLLAALVLAGCATAPAPDLSTLPATPAAFKSTAPAEGQWAVVPPADAAERGTWWAVFADPVLDELVTRALERNTDLQVAAARLQQARAGLREADARRRPQVDASTGVTRATDPGVTTQPVSLGTAGLNLAWELDVFGRLGLASQAQALDAQASEALLQSTRLMVQAQVAQAYFALRESDAERRLVRQTLAAYRDTLRLSERRLAAGDLGELDVQRLRTEVASTEADALALDRQRALQENALAVLLGEAASGFRLAEAVDAEWALRAPVVPAGLPSAVLARRPDVAAAQRSLMAAQARLGVAQSAWLPDLTLTASGGQASTDLGDVFRWSARAWSVGTLLSLPIFDGGRRQAQEDRAAAEAQVALAGYRQQVLTALREVEDQLGSLGLLQRQADALAQAVQSSRRATALSEARYRNGQISQLDLLDARRSELRSLRQAVQVQGAQLQGAVGLIRALGGGWEAG